jgi:hypothetical protein
VKTYTIRPLTFHPVNPGINPDYERWTAHSILGKFRIEREGKEWAWLAPGRDWAVCKDLRQGILLANESLMMTLESDTLSEVPDGKT